MRKTVVISSTPNDEYLFFLPLVVQLWKELGWESVICLTQGIDSGKLKLISDFLPKGARSTTTVFLPQINNVRDETVAQCSRLYVAGLPQFNDEDYIMTSDVDMIPLSDYWKIEGIEDWVTTWGRDLTDYHFPICYIGMKVKRWRDLMSLTIAPPSEGMATDMFHDFNLFPQAKDFLKRSWWSTDQDIITARLLDRCLLINRIDRGIASNSHFPKGRIDRGGWDMTLNQVERIDSHLPRPGYELESFNKILTLLNECYPNLNFDWFKEYRNHYMKLL